MVTHYSKRCCCASSLQHYSLYFAHLLPLQISSTSPYYYVLELPLRQMSLNWCFSQHPHSGGGVSTNSCSRTWLWSWASGLSSLTAASFLAGRLQMSLLTEAALRLMLHSSECLAFARTWIYGRLVRSGISPRLDSGIFHSLQHLSLKSVDLPPDYSWNEMI